MPVSLQMTETLALASANSSIFDIWRIDTQAEIKMLRPHECRRVVGAKSLNGENHMLDTTGAGMGHTNEMVGKGVYKSWDV
jgi:hypothetical protein